MYNTGTEPTFTSYNASAAARIYSTGPSLLSAFLKKHVLKKFYCKETCSCPSGVVMWPSSPPMEHGSWVRIWPGCKAFSTLYVAMLVFETQFALLLCVFEEDKRQNYFKKQTKSFLL
jgi:hypothetical protein